MFKLFDAIAPDVRSKINVLIDCVVLALAAASALSPAGSAELSNWTTGWLGAGIAVTVWLLGSFALKQYDPYKSQGVLGDLALASVHVFAAATALWALRFVAPLGFAPRVLGFLLVCWPALLLVRLLCIGPRLINDGLPESVLVVGTNALGVATGKDVLQSPTRRQLTGFLNFSDEAEAGFLPAPLLGSVDEIDALLKVHAVTEVYIAGNTVKNAESMQRVIRTCERLGVPFALPACGFRLNRSTPANAKAIADGYLHYVSTEHKPVQLALKRLFDIASSAFALAVLSPLLIGVAIVIRLTSKGPVLFRQHRVGMHGRAFHMLKFRSMVINAEELKKSLMADNEQTGPVFKMKHDPRVTRIGRFIRKFSIDELPQLINVLRGEMTIVGPRPPVPNEVDQYEQWQRRRLSVRPGLTCVWQVSGRNQISFEEWMYLDMQYIDNWNLAKDFGLILKTFPVVLTGRGAS